MARSLGREPGRLRQQSQACCPVNWARRVHSCHWLNKACIGLSRVCVKAKLPGCFQDKLAVSIHVARLDRRRALQPPRFENAMPRWHELQEQSFEELAWSEQSQLGENVWHTQSSMFDQRLDRHAITAIAWLATAHCSWP